MNAVMYKAYCHRLEMIMSVQQTQLALIRVELVSSCRLTN